MSQEEYHTIKCPSCGGPIPPFTGPQTTCPFCGTVVERTEPEKPVIQISVGTQQVPIQRTRPRGCISPLVVGLVVLLVAGGALFFVLTPAKSPGPNILISISRSVQGTVIPVASDRSGPDDILVFTYDGSSDQNYLTYVSGADRTLLWDSPPLSSDVYREGIVVSNRKVFVADKAVLMALDQGDGKVAWQTNLSDNVTSTCDGCVRLVNGHVVALSQDGVLQAYEAESGRPAWSVRLNETPRNLWVIAGKVAVLDEEKPNDTYSIALQLRDPATGDVVQHIPGVCQEGYSSNTLPIYDPNIIVDPAGSDVYFLFGLLPGCIQRWNTETGKMAWQTIAEDHYLDRFTAPPFLANGTIYASYNGRVIAVNAENGELRLLVDNQDYDLTLQGERDGHLLVLAERRRGSSRYELWGMDAATGQVLWQNVYADEEPIDAPGGWAADKGIAWHVTRDGLVVLHVVGSPPSLSVERLALATGQGTVLATSSLDGDYWGGLAWSDSTAWLTINKVYTIDLASGKVLYMWP